MKKLAMLLSLIAMVAMTTSIFAQEKGTIDFAIGGPLFESAKGKWSGAEGVTTIAPAVWGRYFVIDNLGINAGLGFTKITDIDAKIDLLLGGRYFYWAKDKMKVGGGLDLAMFMGSGNKVPNDKGKLTNPMSVGIYPAEFQYWPMEGGALYGSPFFEMRGMNLGKAGTNAFGIDLGIMIRIK